MSGEVPVHVEWLGDRADRRPIGLTWTSPARFDHQDLQNWTDDTWSVVLRFDVPPSEQTNPGRGYARFLFPEAPHQWLARSGCTLFDGARAVARVKPLT